MADQEISTSKKKSNVNTQLEELRINFEEVKNTQDSLYKQLKHVNLFIVKVEEAEAAYRTIAESVTKNEQELSRISDLTNDLTTQSNSQSEELQNSFTTWEQTNSGNFETLKKEFKDIETIFLKDTHNQIFGLKKRVSKLEESLTSISETLVGMETWKKKKDLFLFINFALAILILIKLFILG